MQCHAKHRFYSLLPLDRIVAVHWNPTANDDEGGRWHLFEYPHQSEQEGERAIGCHGSEEGE